MAKKCFRLKSNVTDLPLQNPEICLEMEIDPARLIRRIRSLNEDYKLYYWRTAGGAEVDCVIETGTSLIPIEIKASSKVSLSDINGLLSFIKSYKKQIKQAYVVTNGRVPEKLSDMITAIPWRYL